MHTWNNRCGTRFCTFGCINYLDALSICNFMCIIIWMFCRISIQILVKLRNCSHSSDYLFFSFFKEKSVHFINYHLEKHKYLKKKGFYNVETISCAVHLYTRFCKVFLNISFFVYSFTTKWMCYLTNLLFYSNIRLIL